jgi:SET family sugar efflux transporter-like MFS transporter
MSSTAIASALGGLTGSLGVSVLGLPHVFFAPALYGLIATSGIAVMSRSLPAAAGPGHLADNPQAVIQGRSPHVQECP